MAQIYEETAVLTLSKLIKTDSDKPQLLLTNELLSTIEAVAQEMLDSTVVVEIIRK